MTFKYTFNVTDWKKVIHTEVKVFKEKLDNTGIRNEITLFLDRDDVKHISLKSLEVLDVNGQTVEKLTNFNKW